MTAREFFEWLLEVEYMKEDSKCPECGGKRLYRVDDDEWVSCRTCGREKECRSREPVTGSDSSEDQKVSVD